MSQTLSLYRLQQVDTRIDRTKARLQEVQKSLDDDVELRLARESIERTQATREAFDIALKKAEVEAHEQRIKLEQTEASLYGGKGHSPKELLDLQNDVAALKRHLVTLEDTQLDAMVNAENSLNAHTAALSELNSAIAKSTEQNQGLTEERTALQKELDKLFSERAATAGPIPPGVIKVYDDLRQQRRGLAVAVISDNSCSACGSGLSAAQMQSSRAIGQMAFCPSCGRILYGS